MDEEIEKKMDQMISKFGLAEYVNVYCCNASCEKEIFKGDNGFDDDVCPHCRDLRASQKIG